MPAAALDLRSGRRGDDNGRHDTSAAPGGTNAMTSPRFERETKVPRWPVLAAAGAVAALQGCSLVMQAVDSLRGPPAAAADAAVPPTTTGTPGSNAPAAALSPPAAQAVQTLSPPAAPPANEATPAPLAAAAATAAAAQRAEPVRAAPRETAAGNAANPGMGGPFAVQAGAFRAEASAQALRADLAARLAGAGGLSAAQSVVRVIERDGLHRVFVGALDSLAAARALRTRLRGLIGADAFATRP